MKDASNSPLAKEKAREEQENEVIFEEETRISKFRRIVLPKSGEESSLFVDKNLLRGKSLQVYWYLYEHGPAGVREIQRALNYSSPGIITYQIKKLAENGLIVKDVTTEKYSINVRVKAGLLNFYIKIGSRLFPRFSLYLLGFFLGFCLFLLGSFFWGDRFITQPSSLLLLLFLFFGSIIFIYESIVMGKLKPY